MKHRANIRLIVKPAGALLSSLLIGHALSNPAHTDTVTYVYTDLQNTPLAEADSAGNVIARYDYMPYGSLIAVNSPSGSGFTGHVTDTDTNLIYMQARYYDPSMGQFLGPDPLQTNAGINSHFNRYWYANSNPYKYIDPDGRECKTIDGVTTCEPEKKGDGLPPFQLPFPAPSDFSGINSSNYFHHEYRYETHYGDKTDKSVQESIANHPTPGNDKPATPSGTNNNASPPAYSGLASPVKSFTFLDAKGNVWTVNVTLPGHPLHPGYVLRGAVDGKVITYGEGVGVFQAFGPLSQKMINDVWINQNQNNIDYAK